MGYVPPHAVLATGTAGVFTLSRQAEETIQVILAHDAACSRELAECQRRVAPPPPNASRSVLLVVIMGGVAAAFAGGVYVGARAIR